MITIRGHQYEFNRLLNLKPTDIEVTLSGRRFVVKDKNRQSHQLKYNTILKAVLESQANEESKAVLLNSLVPLQNSGRKKFWFLKDLLIKAKHIFGKAKQQQLIQQAQKIINKKISPKKQEGLFSKTFSRLLPQEIIFHIIDQLPLNTPYEIKDAIQIMRWLLKVEPEKPSVFNSIPALTFAEWMIRHHLKPSDCFLSEKDRATLTPLLHPAYHIPHDPFPHHWAVTCHKIKNALSSSSEGPKILDSVPIQNLAAWFNIHRMPLKEIRLEQEELAALIPYLTFINICFKRNDANMAQLLNLINPLIIQNLVISFDLESLPFTLAKIKNFQRLETLSLRLADGPLPLAFLKTLQCLPILSSLDISCNACPPDIMKHYPFPLNLKTLLASGQLIEIEHLMKFQNLQILKIPCSLPSYSAEKMKTFLNTLPHLKELDLSFNSQITGEELKDSKLANTLKKLDLSHAKNFLHIESLKNFTQLESLSLSYTTFSSMELTQVLQSCPQLKNLYLINTEITGDEFKTCASFNTMQTLHVNKCENFNGQYLKQFTHLKQLMISRPAVQ